MSNAIYVEEKYPHLTDLIEVIRMFPENGCSILDLLAIKAKYEKDLRDDIVALADDLNALRRKVGGRLAKRSQAASQLMSLDSDGLRDLLLFIQSDVITLTLTRKQAILLQFFMKDATPLIPSQRTLAQTIHSKLEGELK